MNAWFLERWHSRKAKRADDILVANWQLRCTHQFPSHQYVYFLQVCVCVPISVHWAEKRGEGRGGEKLRAQGPPKALLFAPICAEAFAA